jgi:hypothetical protein
VYGRGFLTGPERGGGGTMSRASDVPVTGLGSSSENSMSLSPCLQMTKGHSFTNDVKCPGPIHSRTFTGSRVASLRHGCRLFRPESHWSNAPAEVQTVGVSFCRRVRLKLLQPWAKCHVRVSKQSCKQANHLILWGVRSTTKKIFSIFSLFFFLKKNLENMI